MNLARSLAQLALSALVFAVSFSAEAQQPTKIPRIGWITAGSLSASQGRVLAFREGLRQFGYVEGKNIIIEWRSPDGKQDRMSSLAAELVHLNLDVIVTGGSGATRPLKQATSTIPIVMAQDQDPVGNGLLPPWRGLEGTSRGCPDLPRS